MTSKISNEHLVIGVHFFNKKFAFRYWFLTKKPYILYMAKSTNGSVYLIFDRINEKYKIGMTKGDVNKRLKQLQTGNATELDLVTSFKTEYPYRMETILHNRFNHKKVLNEWYCLDKEEVDTFLDTCQDIDNMMKTMKNNPFFNKNIR